MTLTPGLRKVVLTAHVASSVGFLGAAAAFLALAIAGLTSQDAQMVRAVYLAAEPITRFVLVPLAFASLLIGIVNALGTPWGLFRHYWVLAKLVLTIFAIIILLLEAQTISYMAGVAAEADSVNASGLAGYVLHSGGGLLVLLVIETLSVYKPRGITRYGWRKQHEERTAPVRQMNSSTRL